MMRGEANAARAPNPPEGHSLGESEDSLGIKIWGL